MRTTESRRRERTCELCGQYHPGSVVRSREIPQGDRMVKRRVCPNCAKAANEISHAVGSQDMGKLAPPGRGVRELRRIEREEGR